MNVFPPHERRLSPFQFYEDMRHNNPVAYDDRNNIWAVFRYYDVQSILGDHTRFSSVPPPERMLQLRQGLLKTDPPYHRILRGAVASAWTPMTISKLEPRIESIAHDLINKVIEKGSMDLIDDLAFPLPVIVIADVLGIPLEDRDTFHEWG